MQADKVGRMQVEPPQAQARDSTIYRRLQDREKGCVVGCFGSVVNTYIERRNADIDITDSCWRVRPMSMRG